MKRLLCIPAALLLSVTLFGCGQLEEDNNEKMKERELYEMRLNAGHVHIRSNAQLTYTVYNTSNCTDPSDITTCQKVAGLPVVAFYQYEDSSSVRVQGLSAGTLVDNGDGTYTWTKSFGDYGTHMVGLKFQKDGHEYKRAFPLHTSMAGGEGYTCDIEPDGTVDHVYQVRWYASDGHVHADGSTATTFTIILKRSYNASPDTSMPWTNDFDVLMPADLSATSSSDLTGLNMTVDLMADAGSTTPHASGLTVSYAGEGAYQVSYTFDSTDLGGADERTFWLDTSFTDGLGCSIDAVTSSTEEEEFHFHVNASH